MRIPSQGFDAHPVRPGQTHRGQEVRIAQGGARTEVVTGLQSGRNLANALTIAHTAQALISKALEVSSRLRNMAGQVIATGNADYREVTAAMSEMKTAIASSPGRSVQPLVLPPLAQGAAQDVSPTHEIELLGDIAEDMRSGRPVVQERFDRIDAALADRERRVHAYREAVEREIGVVGRTGAGADFNPEQAMGAVQSFLRNQPDAAAGLHLPLQRETVQAVLS